MRAPTHGTPTGGVYGTIFVSVELSQRSWLVTMHSPERDRISRRKIDGGAHAALLRLMRRRASAWRANSAASPRW